MPVPDFQSCMLPVLEYHGDGQEHSLRDLLDAMTRRFKLKQAQLDEMLPSGTQSLFENRITWARTYLRKAALLETTRRGFALITDRGRLILAQGITRIDARYLRQFPEFQDFASTKRNGRDESDADSHRTPEELLDDACQKTRSDLVTEILQRLRGCSPAFFERAVVDVLIKMGYGGTRPDAGRAIGRRGDEGIDGIIKEDKLGLDTIYIQAKRWENQIGRPELQKFVGALQGQKANKGVFITTSGFSEEARRYAAGVEVRLILVDGKTLAELMADHGVGVTPVRTIELKRIDSDYFVED